VIQSTHKEENLLRWPPSEQRDALDVHRIMALMPLRPYSVMANVGCGDGVLSIPLAKFLWDGKLTAVDSRQEAVDALKLRMASLRMGNITVLKSDGDSVPLEAGSMDGVVLTWALSRAASASQLLQQAIASVKKGGWCAVIEWRPEGETGDSPPVDRRLSLPEVERLGKEAGLRETLHRELNVQSYMVLFQK